MRNLFHTCQKLVLCAFINRNQIFYMLIIYTICYFNTSKEEPDFSDSPQVYVRKHIPQLLLIIYYNHKNMQSSKENLQDFHHIPLLSHTNNSKNPKMYSCIYKNGSC